jgi:hypothetical protein
MKPLSRTGHHKISAHNPAVEIDQYHARHLRHTMLAGRDISTAVMTNDPRSDPQLVRHDGCAA